MFAGCLGFGLICRLGSSYVTFIQVVTSNRITLSPPPPLKETLATFAVCLK